MDDRPDYRALANQERAYVAASRRPDRGISARVVSAEAASKIHHQRTGRHFHITPEIILSDAQYEEIEDSPRLHLSTDKTSHHVTKRSSGAEKRQLKRSADATKSRYNAMDRFFSQNFPTGFPTASVPDMSIPAAPNATNNDQQLDTDRQDNSEMMMPESFDFAQPDFPDLLQEPSGLAPQPDSPHSDISSIPPLTDTQDSSSPSGTSSSPSSFGSPRFLSSPCPDVSQFVEPATLHTSSASSMQPDVWSEATAAAATAANAGYSSPTQVALRAAELSCFDGGLGDASYGGGYDADLLDELCQNTDLGPSKSSMTTDDMGTNDAFFGFEI